MTSPSDDPTLLLHAALDGELDAAGMIAVERRLAADPALAAEYARLAALRDAIRARLPRTSAPDSLRARVIAMAQAPSPAKPAAPRRAWRFDARYASLAASLALGIVLGAGVYGLLAPPADDDVQRAIVAGFVRGRLSGQPVDVATSDRHTVKPWLAGKIAGATTVVDLKADGFPLVGGRIDVVGKNPVPTLVYQRREHQIALSEMPGAGAASEPRRATRDGYSLIEWDDAGRLYAAVSDLPPAELDAFAAAFRRAAAAEREDAPKP
ncbi:anti-sigma factor [Methylocapsa sp. S129]|uniref:anti-sigma factor family protein n=1 Tax=Methylocapsa sp. S129 TaxID=1641869 RepID=UPI00131E48E6|nr:anti-sigma factor [Methylocapsa sp. S129]